MAAKLEELVPAEEAKYQAAKARAQAVQGLYIHMLVFVVINAGLFLINLATRGSGGSWWFYWPLPAWGVALAIHIMVTALPVFSPQWAERRAERYLSARP